MKGTMVETTSAYALERDGRSVFIEHVPARVCRETGEQYFSPKTAERIHASIKGRSRPAKIIETPVYEDEA